MKISEVQVILDSIPHPDTKLNLSSTKLWERYQAIKESKRRRALTDLKMLLGDIKAHAATTALPDEIDPKFYIKIGKILGNIIDSPDQGIQKLIAFFNRKRIEFYQELAATNFSNKTGNFDHFKAHILVVEKAGLLLEESVTWGLLRKSYVYSNKLALVTELLHSAGLLNVANYMHLMNNTNFSGGFYLAISKLSAVALLSQDTLDILFAYGKNARNATTMLCKIAEKQLYTPQLNQMLLKHKKQALEIMEIVNYLHKRNAYVESIFLGLLANHPSINIKALSLIITSGNLPINNWEKKLPLLFQQEKKLISIKQLFEKLIDLHKNTGINIKWDVIFDNLVHIKILNMIVRFIEKEPTQERHDFCLKYFHILKRDAIFVRLERMPKNSFTRTMFGEMLNLCQANDNDPEKAEQAVIAYLNRQFEDLTKKKLVNQLKNDTQSTHTNTIHIDTSESIKKLFNHYKDDPLAQPLPREELDDVCRFLEYSYEQQKTKLQAINNELVAAGFAEPEETPSEFVLWKGFIQVIMKLSLWGQHLKEDNNFKRAAAYRALERLLFVPYFIEFKDATSNITIPELLALFWLAIHDDELRVGALEDALELFVEALYEIQRDGNINEFNQDNNLQDSFICGGGTINKLIEKLRAIHPLVNTRMLTPYLAGLRLPKVVTEKVVEYLIKLPATSKTEICSTISLVNALLIEGIGDLWSEHIEPKVAKIMFDEYGPLYNGGMQSFVFKELIAQGEYRSFDKKALNEVIQKIIIDCYASLELPDMREMLQQLVTMDWLSEEKQIQIVASQKYKVSILNSFKQLERLQLATYDNFLLIINHAAVLETMSIAGKIAQIILPEAGVKQAISPQEHFISLMKECEQPPQGAKNSSFYDSLPSYRSYQENISPNPKRLLDQEEEEAAKPMGKFKFQKTN